MNIVTGMEVGEKVVILNLVKTEDADKRDGDKY